MLFGIHRKVKLSSNCDPQNFIENNYKLINLTEQAKITRSFMMKYFLLKAVMKPKYVLIFGKIAALMLIHHLNIFYVYQFQ